MARRPVGAKGGARPAFEAVLRLRPPLHPQATVRSRAVANANPKVMVASCSRELMEMKTLKVALAALALAGCSSQSSHTVAVTGAPDEVARFVAAEEARPGGAEVDYRAGGNRAVFSVPTSEAQSGVMLRASAAALASETRSTSWSFSSGS